MIWWSNKKNKDVNKRYLTIKWEKVNAEIIGCRDRTMLGQVVNYKMQIIFIEKTW